MKRITTLIGLGVGLALGGGLVYAFFTSEAARLLVVGLVAFVLAAFTIGGTALLVNRQWTRALGAHRTTHNHRYRTQIQPPMWGEPMPRQQQPEGLLPGPGVLPAWDMVETQQREDDEVVA